eukprot:CAMPEP_0168279392 /NCGR_PEP_ID=MMETSP0141_2-20121125/20458_1 /TAXON_ID=44445 /ORGANISM="Pseudo-nitzschia australis, Strain 10249 10 AB" /LENGTH=126 /DNA_ID=CAMNT_0008222345 /DNA_START=425 /DNA_END=808 /DNA_ORIENTATION=+
MADSSSATTNTSSERDPLMQQQQQQQHRHAMEYTREWNENERDSSEPNGNDAAASAVAGLIQQHTKKTPMTTTMMPTEEDFGCERASTERMLRLSPVVLFCCGIRRWDCRLRYLSSVPPAYDDYVT